jgi:hypothetical protein
MKGEITGAGERELLGDLYNRSGRTRDAIRIRQNDSHALSSFNQGEALLDGQDTTEPASSAISTTTVNDAKLLILPVIAQLLLVAQLLGDLYNKSGRTKNTIRLRGDDYWLFSDSNNSGEVPSQSSAELLSVAISAIGFIGRRQERLAHGKKLLSEIAQMALLDKDILPLEANNSSSFFVYHAVGRGVDLETIKRDGLKYKRKLLIDAGSYDEKEDEGEICFANQNQYIYFQPIISQERSNILRQNWDLVAIRVNPDDTWVFNRDYRVSIPYIMNYDYYRAGKYIRTAIKLSEFITPGNRYHKKDRGSADTCGAQPSAKSVFKIMFF